MPGGELAAVRRRAGAHGGVPVVEQAGHRLRPRGHRHAAAHHHAVPHRTRPSRGTGRTWKLVAGRRRVRRRRAHLLRRQPHQDRPGRLAAAAGRGARRHRDDHLAARAAASSPRAASTSRGRCRTSSTSSTRATSPGVPGTAVFPHPTKETAPLALRANVEFNHVLHERVVIVSVLSENVPHVPPDERVARRRARHARRRHRAPVGPVRVPGRAGPPRGAPPGRAGCRDELDIDPDDASYFLSRMTIERGRQPGMSDLAQADVHRARPQRGQPRRLLLPARRPHRDHGLPHRAVIVNLNRPGSEFRSLRCNHDAVELLTCGFCSGCGY